MPDATAPAATPSIDIFTASMARLNEVGNMSVQQAVENSGRLSAMFGVRAAQANPIEATAINSLKASEAGGNAQNNAIATALMTLTSALANLAHVTPATQAPPTQAK